MEPAPPRAEAVAILGEPLVGLARTREGQALAGHETRMIDAGQGTVLPGFNDAHVHFLAGGFSLSNVDLRSASSSAELAQRLAKYASRIPQGRWILGGDWDHETWLGTLQSG